MNESSKEIIRPAPKGHKAKRGDCGTCLWFDRVPEEPKNNDPWSGWCLYNPPVPRIDTQVNQLTNQIRPMFQGIVPPTFETRRCHHWRPAGTAPPFDDEFEMVRPHGKE